MKGNWTFEYLPFAAQEYFICKERTPDGQTETVLGFYLKRFPKTKRFMLETITMI